MRQAQVTQSALAVATTVKQPTINRILLGYNVAPKEATLHLLAKYFKISTEDLRFKNLSDPSALPQHLRGVRIPMVNSKVAGLQRITNQWPETVLVYADVSPEAFAMDIYDRGMEPRLVMHDTVVIEPTIIPEPGQWVAARVQGIESAIIRVYKATEFTQAKRHFSLLPLNENYSPLQSQTVDIRILGVAVARWERLI